MSRDTVGRLLWALAFLLLLLSWTGALGDAPPFVVPVAIIALLSAAVVLRGLLSGPPQ